MRTMLETRALMYLLRREREREMEMEKQKNCESSMEIIIKKEDAMHFAGLIYLGNLVINGYKNTKDVHSEYEDLANDIYGQIIKSIPQTKPIYEFKNMPNEKSLEAQIADFRDEISDAVDEYYLDFQETLIDDLIAE